MSAVESLDILQRCLFFLVAAHGIAAKQKKNITKETSVKLLTGHLKLKIILFVL